MRRLAEAHGRDTFRYRTLRLLNNASALRDFELARPVTLDDAVTKPMFLIYSALPPAGPIIF